MTGIVARLALLAIAGWVATAPVIATAASPTPYPGTNVFRTNHSYDDLVKRLNAAIRSNRMGIVAKASATLGAKSIGVNIPGNMIIMVFRPDFAVRMLKASVPAGIEAPLRYYITEDPNRKATLVYRTPSAVFRPYGSADLNGIAVELDEIFSRIAREAVGP